MFLRCICHVGSPSISKSSFRLRWFRNRSCISDSGLLLASALHVLYFPCSQNRWVLVHVFFLVFPWEARWISCSSSAGPVRCCPGGLPAAGGGQIPARRGAERGTPERSRSGARAFGGFPVVGPGVPPCHAVVKSGLGSPFWWGLVNSPLILG